MKFALYAVCIALTLALAAAADTGYFLPRAYYTIDTEGHVSDLQPIAPQVLRRLRRDGVSASSSSSSSSDGRGVYTSHHVQTNGPGFVGGLTGAATGGGVHFDSRFSDDSPSGAFGGGSSYPSDAYGSGIGSGIGSSGVGGFASHSGESYVGGSGTDNGSYRTGSGRTSSGTYTNRDGESRPVFGSRYVGASSSGSISSGGPNFESRFGGISSTFSNEDGRTSGRTIHTSGYIDKDGRVHQKTTESHI